MTDQQKPADPIPADGPALRRVLLVDDEPLVLLILAEFLRGHALECTESFHAQDALEQFSSGTFDLVLTDLKMKGMDGLALTTELKRMRPTQKVILLSGMEPLSMPSPESGGPDAFLSKPFTRTSLIECVAKVMSPR